MTGGLALKSTGIVFDSGLLVGPEPHATILYDKSRYRSNGDFRADGQPDWVRLPSGLWVMDFDPAAPDYVEIPADQTQLNFTSEDFSFVARIKVDDLTASRWLFTRGLINADGWYTYIDRDGRVSVYTNQAAANQNSHSTAGGIIAGNWYTVGFSRSGASVRIYVNGIDDTATVGVHIDPLTCARSAKIGIHDNLAAQPFDGKIAFLRIYNYALTPAQIRAIFQAERHWFGI